MAGIILKGEKMVNSLIVIMYIHEVYFFTLSPFSLKVCCLTVKVSRKKSFFSNVLNMWNAKRTVYTCWYILVCNSGSPACSQTCMVIIMEGKELQGVMWFLCKLFQSYFHPSSLWKYFSYERIKISCHICTEWHGRMQEDQVEIYKMYECTLVYFFFF